MPCASASAWSARRRARRRSSTMPAAGSTTWSIRPRARACWTTWRGWSRPACRTTAATACRSPAAASSNPSACSIRCPTTAAWWTAYWRCTATRICRSASASPTGTSPPGSALQSPLPNRKAPSPTRGEESTNSVQLLPQLLQQPCGALALLVVVRQLEIAGERAARGENILQPRVEDAAFAPQLGLHRRDPQHSLQRALGALEVALLDAPHLDVVLQPEQDLPVLQGREMLRLDLGLVGRLRFQQLPQVLDRARQPAGERIEDHRLPVAMDPDHEMAGEVQPLDAPAERPRRVDVQNR